MSAGRAAVAIARDGNFEIDVHLIRQCRHPGENISELVLLLGSCSLANCLSQLADFLCEPGNGRRNSALSVPFPVGGSNGLLQFAESHIDTVNDSEGRCLRSPQVELVDEVDRQLLERRMWFRMVRRYSRLTVASS